MQLFNSNSITQNSLIFAGFLLAAWLIFSIVYLLKKNKNPYLHKAIPSVFTTLGILGTFIGIVAGLLNFDANDIGGSLPELLNGLRFSFISSIAGIFFAFIFSRIIEYQLQKQDLARENNVVQIVRSPDQLTALNHLSQLIEQQNNLLAEKLNTNIQLTNNQNNILAEKLTEVIGLSVAQNDLLTEKLTEANRLNTLQNVELTAIKNTSEEQTASFNQLNTSLGESFKNLMTVLKSNQASILNKLENFSQELQRNNTDALVEVMKQATEDFNRQMSEIINQLVQENFEMLNQSVANLVGWQQDNKAQMEQLVKDYQTVSAHFTNTAKQTENIAIASQNITTETQKATQELTKITTQTASLVAEEGKLQTIVNELNEVMVNDKVFTQISNNLKDSSQQMIEANKGVELMIDWQKDNKAQMAQLVEDYQTVSAHFTTTAQQTENIANESKKINTEMLSIQKLTKELVADKGKLQQLIIDLNKVIVEDNAMTQLADKLKANSETLLESNTKNLEALKELTVYLNDNRHLNENTGILIKAIEEFKNTNSDYWQSVRKELEKSVGTINTTIGNRDKQYEKWLTDTLSNLDNTMERYMRGN